MVRFVIMMYFYLHLSMFTELIVTDENGNLDDQRSDYSAMRSLSGSSAGSTCSRRSKRGSVKVILI